MFSSAVAVDADWTPPVYEKNEEEKEKIKHVIDKNILFMNLDEKTKDTIVSAMAKRRYIYINNSIKSVFILLLLLLLLFLLLLLHK